MNSGGADTSTGSGATLSGYLTKPVKNGKSIVFRRKRFYKLDGALLSKHAHKVSHKKPFTAKQSTDRPYLFTVADLFLPFFSQTSIRQGSPASAVRNMQGAEIKDIGNAMFAITLQHVDNKSTQGQKKEVLVLSAKTEKECMEWMRALQSAAQRKIDESYEVGQVIGEGGFATVRIGRCMLTKELRAIKTLKKDDTYAKLQGNEIAILKSTDHPNIVKTYDVFETRNEIHIVMEYMAGGMLYEAIEDGIIFSEPDVIQFMREILDAILYLHGKGIVHRDLKPENILCTSRTTPLHVKIADFGLSCINSVADLTANKVLMSTMIGTPEFIAPEIARQEPYTEKVDMWALGMLCYNVIAGALPIDESRDVVPQLRDGVKLTFPERVWKSYSRDAQSCLRALLCTQPQKRLSPLGCMVHPWLEKDKGRASTKIGAHGRVSHRISRMNFASYGPRNINKHLEVQKFNNNVNTGNAFSGKSRWRTAYLVVAATNRFRLLVSSVEPRKFATLDSNDSLNLDVAELESDSEESSLGSAKLSFFLKAVRNSAEKLDRRSLPSPKETKKSFRSKPRQSSDGFSKMSGFLDDREDKASSGPRSLTAKMMRRDRGKSDVYHEGVVSKKKSTRSKDRAETSSAASPLRKASRKLTKVGTTGIMGPLRKLSRKLTGSNIDRRGDIGDDEDFEDSLAGLGVTDVDEDDLLKLENADCSNLTTVSKFSNLEEY